MLRKLGGHGSVNTKVKLGLYHISFYLRPKDFFTRVPKYKYEGLPRGVRNSLDFLRYDIKTFVKLCESLLT